MIVNHFLQVWSLVDFDNQIYKLEVKQEVTSEKAYYRAMFEWETRLEVKKGWVIGEHLLNWPLFSRLGVDYK